MLCVTCLIVERCSTLAYASERVRSCCRRGETRDLFEALLCLSLTETGNQEHGKGELQCRGIAWRGKRVMIKRNNERLILLQIKQYDYSIQSHGKDRG